MAPGRRKGGNKAKAKSSLSLGDLVLAKVKGHPAWPAKISRPEDWKQLPDPKKYFVEFFGTKEIAFVAPMDIQAFTIEAKSKISAKCQNKKVKHFAQAVKEICVAFEELQQKKSNGLRDDNDKSVLGVQVLPVGGLEDGISVDMEDDARRVGSNGGVEGNGDIGSGLGHCSHGQGEIDSQDKKLSMPCCASESLAICSDVKHIVSDDAQRNDTKSSPDKEDVIRRNHLKGTDLAKGSSFGKNKHSSVSEQDCSSDMGDGKKKGSPSLTVSHLTKHSSGGQRSFTDGHKSKKITGSKRKHGDAVEVQKGIKSAIESVKDDTSAGCDNLLQSGKHSRDKTKGKLASGGRARDSLPDAHKSDLEINVDKKVNKSSNTSDRLVTVTNSKKMANGELSVSKKGDQYELGKSNVGTNKISRPAKKSKLVDVGDNTFKGSNSKSINNDSSVLNAADDKTARQLDSKRSTTSHLKGDNSLVSRAHTGNIHPNVSGDEDDLPVKRHRRALEALSDTRSLTSDVKMENNTPLLKNDESGSRDVKGSARKRRSVRLFDDDDDDEEPKTPVHGGSVKNVKAPSYVLETIKSTDVKIQVSHNADQSVCTGFEDCPSKVSSPQLRNETLTPVLQIVEKRPEQAMATHVSGCPANLEPQQCQSKEFNKILISPVKSPRPVLVGKPAVEQQKSTKTADKVAITQRKVHTGSGKGVLVSDSLISSQNKVASQKNRSTSFGERSKATSKLVSRVNESVAVRDARTTENNSLHRERLEASREDKTISSVDSNLSDSVMSMKDLIAVAQEKRRQAQSQNFYPNSALLSTTDMHGRSPSPSAVMPFLSGSSNVIQTDIQILYNHTFLDSPSARGLLSASENHLDSEEVEEKQVGSGNRAAGGSLSGGTEAAVARDSFEGMIETLSRTKESIGRATRLAIDCAKYGIANEVVELLIQKLETESSFHRKVDLFFLVDSITQCSHNYKGIASASYIPTVQAALPRLIGAAAPPGASARENRRQCLKVLRLWLERKILPESLLRHYMDDIGGSNDDTTAGFFSKRPFRAERALDDPIREMEGLLVDEYGSNATFQLPGFLSSRVFEEEEDEEDIPGSACKEAGDASLLDPAGAVGDGETCTPIDRRHCILEDVDVEFEMEDVSGHTKDERPFSTNGPSEIASQQQGSECILESASNKFYGFPPLPEGSPPLPLDSPPPPPPLPPSPPPPPPPPPLSPSPPPLPPPPPLLMSQPPSHLVPSSGPLPLVSQPSTASQTSLPPPQLLQPQSSLQSSPQLAYQLPLPHDYCGTPGGHQLVQMARNTPHGSHVDAALSSEMFPLQSPCFVPSGICNSGEPSGFNSSRHLEYGHNDMYLSTQTSQSNQQFQPGNVPFVQRSLHPRPSQTPSNHFSYSKPTIQQHPQHLYPPPYSLLSLPDGRGQFGADDQWRMSSSEFNTDKQHGVWISGGRTPCSVSSFVPEGIIRPSLERPPSNNSGFQLSTTNNLPPGPPVSGHGVSQMLPCRPDLSAINCWRPV